MPGEFFLVHHVYVDMGGYDYNVMEVIGAYDASSRIYSARSFDSKGIEVVRQVQSSDDTTWTFTSDTQRARLAVSDNSRTITSTWEQSDDGSNWHPWMDMKLTKVS
jgi:hypothetical protein